VAEILVIGAGIVGLSAAYHLRADGHKVTLVDREPDGDRASSGNAGGIGVSEIVPASVPGLVWRVPGWLFDPLGPLSLRWRHFPAMVPWLRRFLRSGSSAEVERITTALAALAHRCFDDLVPLLATLGLSSEMHRVGALTVYETSAGFLRERPEWNLKRRHGIVAEELTGDQAREREPALGPLVRHAISTPQWAHVSDPAVITRRLLQWLQAHGVAMRRGEALRVVGRRLQLTDGGELPFDMIVVAAGAWSGRLARSLGDRVLLESERGYNTTLPSPGVQLQAEVIFGERKFVATPLAMGLRIGGAAEFAGLEAPPNYARCDAMLALATRYLPGLRAKGGTRWMGHRPTTPDSLPVIGRSPRRRDVLYAFGHGHTGLTFGPTTGRLIAELAAGRSPSLDLMPFAIERFA
jgi:D-amino-acid dehydrogenase